MQQIDASSPPSPKAPLLTPYVAAWAAFACLALAYLGVMVLKPDIVARYWPVAPVEGEPQTNQGQRADVLAEVRALKDTVSDMQKDVSAIKIDLSSQQALSQSWETRISALEPKNDTAVAEVAKSTSGNMKSVAVKGAKTPVQAAQALPAVPAKSAQAAAPQAAPQAASQAVQQSLLDAAAVTGGDIPLSEAGDLIQQAAPAVSPTPSSPANIKSLGGKSAELKVINAPPADPALTAPAIETGSVGTKAAQAPVANFGPATVTSTQPQKAAGIVIGNGSSLDSLRLSWSLLADRHAGTIGKLQPRYTTGVDANGLTYDLVAGPVKSTAEAKKICKDLVAKAIACRVSDFTGEAL